MAKLDLLKWRKSRGWTQKQAAEALGLPIRTWIAWEKERRRPSQLLPLAIAHLDSKLPQSLRDMLLSA